MGVLVNIEGDKGLRVTYIKDGKWKAHHKKISIKLLPFTTSFYKECSDDLRSFHGLVGECLRIRSGIRFPKELKSDKESSYKRKLKEYILKEVETKVDTDEKDAFKDIVIKLFFEENSSMIKFNRKVLPYLNFDYEKNQLNETAKFLFDIFLSDQEINTLDLIQNSNNNLFYQLIIECLPELEKSKVSSASRYINVFPKIRTLFLKDLLFLSSDEGFFLRHIEDLFKYYYFFYLTQLAKSFNSFGKTSLKPVFFSMDWETLSESRLAYQYGWRTISTEMNGLFAHVNTLELLNYISEGNDSIGDYNQIRQRWDSMDSAQRLNLVDAINEISEVYSTHIRGFDSGESWDKCEVQTRSYIDRHRADIENDLDEALICFYKKVEYQFFNTERKSAHERYGKWMDIFVRNNFTKTRGRLGATTVLNQEFLLFLVKLCIGREEKIRLNELWKELEDRGISFDEPTKNEIIKLFERINLLEKKSDSGDAQYVKTII